MQKTIAMLTAAATLVGGLAVPAYAKPIVPDAATLPRADGFEQVQYRRGCYPGETRRDCRERQRWERRYRDRYYYRGGRYYRRDRDGDELAAAIIGFALGAAIMGSRDDYNYYYSRRNDRRYIERCRVRYRSFDPYTGTYVTTTGYRRYCRL